jgi:steroid delta-isomerase-like uncharacterized protein
MGNVERVLSSLVVAVVVMLMVAGCADQEKAIEEQNKAVVRYVHEEVSKGNAAVFAEVLTPDYIRHCQAMPPELQEMHGTEQFIAFINDFLTAVPDCRDVIDLMIAEGDKVAYITTMTGTQTGQMGAFPASGKKFKAINIIIHRFEEGKIAETWVSWDNVAFLSQLGFFPPPGEGEN